MCKTRLVTLIALVLTLASFSADAQQAGKVYQVGLLSNGGNPKTWRTQYAAFLDGMRELNYVEGRNVIFKPAFGDGQADRIPALAAELVRAKVDVIVASAATEVEAAKKATSSIPIVMWLVTDPVAEGYAASLARPGGNVTGLTSQVPGLGEKYVELLREAVPSASRFVVVSGTNPRPDLRRELETAGRALGVAITIAHVTGPDDFDDVLARARKDGATGLIATSDAVTFLHRRALAQSAIKHGLPGIYWSRVFVEAGGLMTYSANTDDLRRRAATYVDKILRGASPADLPIEQPTKFELLINLKTAKALGLKIPPSLLLRADQVLE